MTKEVPVERVINNVEHETILYRPEYAMRQSSPHPVSLSRSPSPATLHAFTHGPSTSYTNQLIEAQSTRHAGFELSHRYSNSAKSFHQKADEIYYSIASAKGGKARSRSHAPMHEDEFIDMRVRAEHTYTQTHRDRQSMNTRTCRHTSTYFLSLPSLSVSLHPALLQSIPSCPSLFLSGRPEVDHAATVAEQRGLRPQPHVYQPTSPYPSPPSPHTRSPSPYIQPPSLSSPILHPLCNGGEQGGGGMHYGRAADYVGRPTLLEPLSQMAGRTSVSHEPTAGQGQGTRSPHIACSSTGTYRSPSPGYNTTTLHLQYLQCFIRSLRIPIRKQTHTHIHTHSLSPTILPPSLPPSLPLFLSPWERHTCIDTYTFKLYTCTCTHMHTQVYM